MAARADVRGAASTDQSTPLHFAAAAGKAGAVTLLLDAKVDTRAATQPVWAVGFGDVEWRGERAVDCARAFQRTDVVRIVERTAVCESEGASALHVAAWERKHADVLALLARGADVNAATRDGVTPLHAACARSEHSMTEAVSSEQSRGGQSTTEHVVRALVAAHADLSAPRRDQDLMTPLHAAGRGGRVGACVAGVEQMQRPRVVREARGRCPRPVWAGGGRGCAGEGGGCLKAWMKP
eukprot:540364-Rhodomonas_salina.2